MPFELGRPFGAPDEPDFQTRVLRDALALLVRDGPPPLLEDFPDPAPGSEAVDMTGWTCPIALAKPKDTGASELLNALTGEIESLAPWQQLAKETRGRTSTGVLGLSIEEIADFLHDLLAGTPENPKPDIPLGETFRQASEELKVFYFEAATAKPGAVSSRALADWFWGETTAGKLLLALHPVALASDDPGLQWVAKSQLVPRAQQHLLG